MAILCVVGEDPAGLGEGLSAKPGKVSCSSSQIFWALTAVFLVWLKRWGHSWHAVVLGGMKEMLIHRQELCRGRMVCQELATTAPVPS